MYSHLKVIKNSLTAIMVSSLSFSAVAISADTALRDARIYTVNEKQTWAEAVAIRDGEIVYVGDDAGLKDWVGPNTQVIDVDGKLLLPGFIDTHAHPVLATASMNALEINAEDDLATVLEKLQDYADDNPNLDFIMGFGFSHHIFDGDPTKEMLDAVVSERPVFLADGGGHLGWANSKAFELAGVNADTPDPIAGSHYYVRDVKGNPTGYMYEEQTFAAFINLGQGNVASEMRTNSADLFPLMSSMGITSVFDASMEWFIEDGHRVMAQLEKEGKLPFRLVTSMTVDRNLSHGEVVNQYKEFQSQYHSDFLQIGAIKFGLDGTVEGESAALLNNYLHGGSGALNWQEKPYGEIILALDTAGIDIHIHAIGDRAVNVALNAIEAARQQNGFHGTRHTICHTQLVQDSDIPRFNQLKVIAQTTPVWHADAPSLEWTTIDETERQKLFPFKSIADTGARVTFGSDFPYGGGLEALVPAYNLEVGHTRVWPGLDVAPLPNPKEKLPLQTLIKGYTLDAAYQLRMEDKIGSIEVGKRADLIVMDENIFEISPQDIHNVKVEITMVDGKVVYERPFYQWLIEWYLEI